MVKNEGVELTVEADRLAGNVAGILVSKKTGICSALNTVKHLFLPF